MLAPFPCFCLTLVVYQIVTLKSSTGLWLGRTVGKGKLCWSRLAQTNEKTPRWLGVVGERWYWIFVLGYCQYFSAVFGY